MKKTTVVLLVITILAQLILPGYYIADKYGTLHSGTVYKFEIHDPYVVYRGKYLHISLVDNCYDEQGKYGTVGVNADGYAYITGISDNKPDEGDYIKSGYGGRYYSIPVDRYYTDEDTAAVFDSYMWRFVELPEMYVTVRVNNGECVAEQLYIDGVTVEEFVKTYDFSKLDEYESEYFSVIEEELTEAYTD